MDVAMLELHIEQIGQVTAVQLVGSIDSITAIQVQDEIIPLAASGKKILLDMSKVTYLSSAGLRALLLIYRSICENIGRIVLMGLTDEVRDIMAITGFIEFFETAEDHRAAMQTLN